MGAPLWCTGPAVFRESPRPGGLNEVADLPIGAHEDPGAVLSFAASDDPLRPCRFSQGSDHGVVPSGSKVAPSPSAAMGPVYQNGIVQMGDAFLANDNTQKARWRTKSVTNTG